MVIISSLYNCFLKLTVQFLLTLVSGIFWHIPCVTLDGLHFPTSFMAHTMIVPPGCWVPPVTAQQYLYKFLSIMIRRVVGSPQRLFIGLACSHWFHSLTIIVTPGLGHPPVSVQGRSLQSLVPLPYHNRNAGLLGPPGTVQRCPLQSLDVYLQHDAQ